MRYHVIYSFETSSNNVALYEYNPPLNQRKRSLWKLTERDDYFAVEEWKERGGYQRKWVAELSQSQFDTFIEHCELYAEDVATGGTLGGAGGFGWAPAWSFYSEHYDCFSNAYVTPVPETDEEYKCLTLKKEEEIRKAFLERYGPRGQESADFWTYLNTSKN